MPAILQWVEGSHSTWTAVVVGFKLQVSWAVNGYGFMAKFENWTLNKRFNTVEEAQKAVQKFALDKCQEAVGILENK